MNREKKSRLCIWLITVIGYCFPAGILYCDMTVSDVFRLVLKKKFYCSWTNDTYKMEVIEKLKDTEIIPYTIEVVGTRDCLKSLYLLKSAWNIRAISMPGNIIKTISKSQHGPSHSVVLYWAPYDVRDGIDYHEAREMVREFNENNHLGYSDWRIPRLEEIFFILKGGFKSYNFFPFDNGSGILKRNIKLWTSTPVDKKEGRVIGRCGGDAYYVFDNIHAGDYHSITFNISCAGDNAYLLPVSSGKKPKIIKPPPKIEPPEEDRTIISPPHTSLTTSLTVTYFNFMDFVKQTSLESTDMGELIEEAIRAGIQKAGESAKYLATDRNIQSDVNTAENAGKLAAVLFDPGLEQDEKIQRIIHGLMTPKRVDIMVTGLYIRTLSSSNITIRPMVIVKSTRKILTRNLEFTLNELECDHPDQNRKILCKRAYEEIVRTIKELLQQAW